jgi:hypothetical protein
MDDPLEDQKRFRALYKLAVRAINQGNEREANNKLSSAAYVAREWGAKAGWTIDDEAKMLILTERYGNPEAYSFYEEMQEYRYLGQFDIDPVCWRDSSKWPGSVKELKKSKVKRRAKAPRSEAVHTETPVHTETEAEDNKAKWRDMRFSPLPDEKPAPEASRRPQPEPSPVHTETPQPGPQPEPQPVHSESVHTETPEPEAVHTETKSRREYLKAWRALNPGKVKAHNDANHECHKDARAAYRAAHRSRYTQLKRESRARLKAKEGS